MGLDNCEILQSSDRETIRLFQSKVYYQQLLVESELTDFISDRSIFDIVAYMEFYGLPSELVDQYLQYAIKHSANYDAIIYCPIPKGVELTADGFRLLNGQKEYDFILKRLLFQAECRVVKLTRDRSQWLDRILAISPVKKYTKARKSA
jgi:nicotinamide riboside kinase